MRKTPSHLLVLTALLTVAVTLGCSARTHAQSTIAPHSAPTLLPVSISGETRPQPAASATRETAQASDGAAQGWSISAGRVTFNHRSWRSMLSNAFQVTAEYQGPRLFRRIATHPYIAIGFIRGGGNLQSPLNDSQQWYVNISMVPVTVGAKNYFWKGRAYAGAGIGYMALMGSGTYIDRATQYEFAWDTAVGLKLGQGFVEFRGLEGMDARDKTFDYSLGMGVHF